MSQESRPAQQFRAPKVATEDLENKLMEVGQHKYNFDMKQHGESRFFSITDTSNKSRRNRVVVPMSVCVEFCEKVHQVVAFMGGYVPKNVSGQRAQGEAMKFAHSISMFTPAKRRYYFDVIDAEEALTLRISYVFGDRRDSILLVYDCLSSMLDILEGFQRKYPSMSPSDDYQFKGRRNDNHRGGLRRGRGFGGRRFEREGRAPRGRTNFPPRAEFEAAQDGRKAQSLKVCSDPAPAQFSNNAKKFTFEIVEGANTFMRITEMINDSRKSTLHVPIDCLAQVQNVLGEMNKRFQVTKSTQTTANS